MEENKLDETMEETLAEAETEAETAEEAAEPNEAEVSAEAAAEEKKPQKKGKKKKKKSKRDRVFNILIIILCCVLIFSAAQLVISFIGYQQNDKVQNEVASIFYSSTTGETEDSQMQGETGTTVWDWVPETETILNEEGEEETTMVNEFHGGWSIQSLVDENSDCVGWIHINNTVIDFPVMLCPEDQDNYYLHYSFYKSYLYAGVPYMNASANTLGGEHQNYVIYGHRMLNGSMFWDLGDYLEQEFYDENPSFRMILRENGEDVLYKCEVYAAYQTLWNQDYEAWTPSFESDEEMLEYVAGRIEHSQIVTTTEVEAGDTLVTLSTCSSGMGSSYGRLLVHARLVKLGSVPIPNHATQEDLAD